LIVGAFILCAPAAKGNPIAVHCKVDDIRLPFDSTDLLSRNPQVGSGNIVVHLSSASGRMLKLPLIANISSHGAPNGDWILFQSSSSAMGLKAFVLPKPQRSLGTTATPECSLTHAQWTDGNSKIAVSIPFFTQLTLSDARPAACTGRQPTADS
jgi:hypothetical protein